MNAQLAPDDSDIEPAPEGAQALLRSVVITDLCDSTALVDRLGDVRATELIRAHDRLLRGLIREHRGQEIDKTDGFLSLFERPIQAVAFALAYQRGLRAFSLEHGIEVSARIGLHVGEVMTWQNDEADIAKGAKPTEVEGLAKPVAARLMGMALPGQILLSGVAYTLAHRAESELGAALSRLQWKAHGDFRFKGVAEAVPVYEIGEEGIAPFKAPAWSGKAHREVPLWRRPVMLAFEAIALIAALALPAWHFLKPEPAIAFAERDWVVLADLRNLTGDPRFDDSLEQAFRIGLEQSRHVNVLSDLQVRDTLQRMQRDSDSPVDRSIGAEIAMREGARALVLPTLAEVGGRLRFTAEVIHPNTQATVYSEYADGRGAEAVLPLVDEVNRKLRGRLGEAVDQVSENSRALERVTTPNLDALSAYTRARALLLERNVSDAISLLNAALSLDPEFAAASLELAIIMNDRLDPEGALAHLKLALANSNRLTHRQIRHASALEKTIASAPEEAIEAWRTLTIEFPDFYVGWGALAWYQWIYMNDLAAARQAVERNIDARNPRRNVGHYLLGSLLLASNDPLQAIEQFKVAEELGLKVENRIYSSAYAVQRDFSRSRSVLERGTVSDASEGGASKALAFATHLADRGRLKEAQELLARTRASIEGQRGFPSRVLAIAESAVLTAEDEEHHSVLATALARALSDQDREARSTLSLEASTRALEAWAAAGLSEPLAGEASTPRDVARSQSVRAQIEALERARRMRVEGQAAAAAKFLGDRISVTSPFAMRVELMRALVDAGDFEAAEAHAKWVSENRGRAYVEPDVLYGLAPYNAFWSSRALLLLARIHLELAQRDAAKKYLSEFEAVVDESELSSATLRELAEIRSQLQPAAS
ncbi:putative peptide modification system cyclase [Aquimonas voraii]|uniref:Putative peptide modification system cyclase n=1 Tax=Aquimonas voraii TaxID=265719 RepID=A0A1G6X2C7_9GAMM|nr:putative peptide modification system cyclase [Aquimonas voraii]SDD72340.1 putative peptide modification system cyclase [Aquimonas voraii]